MIFDTDVLIWVQRGNRKAAALVERTEERAVSVLTYMELLQCATSKKQIQTTKDFLSTFQFITLPLSENIGHRAAVYVEEYSVSTGLRAVDALIAATATENNMELSTGNKKHFSNVRDLRLSVFKP